MKIFRLLSALLALMVIGAFAQNETAPFQVPTTNSSTTIQQRVAATDIEIKYNRPNVKGRKIFGELVPYGKIWRTGSDAATSISFSTPVTLNGTPIEAGSYEIFSIPGESEWTVILEEKLSQWGSYAYDPANDVVWLTVKPIMLSEKVETFTISIDDVTNSTANLNISWDKVRVPVKIEIDVRKTVVPQLEAALQKEGRRPYFRAAMFYYENDLDINRAVELMAKAIEQNPTHIGMLYRQALILEKKGDIAGAKAAAEKSLAGAAEAKGELRDEYTRLNTILLDRIKKK